MPVAGFPQFGKFDRPSADADRMLLGQIVDSANALSALARVSHSGGFTTVDSSTPTLIAGCTVTFTPDLDVRALVSAVFDVRCGTLGAAFEGNLFVNGVAETVIVYYVPENTRHRATVPQLWSADLAAGVAVTLELKGKTTAGTTHFVSANSGFTVLLVPR